MSSDAAFLEAYDALELELPSGDVVRCKPLTLTQAAGVIRLLRRAESGDAGALCELMTEFPRMVGAAEALDALLPSELPEVVARFLALRRLPNSRTPATRTATKTQSDAGSTT